MKELLLRTLTGITLVALVTGSILLGPISFSLILLLIYFLAVRELFILLQKRNLKNRWLRAIPGALFIPIIYLVFNYDLSIFYLLVPPLLWLLTALRGGITLSGTLSLLWLAVPLSSFYMLGWMSEEPGYQYQVPLSLIALIWLNDTFAYVTGSLLGRRQMTPVLSPGKTWEGFVGGTVITILCGWIAWRLTGLYSPWVWIIISVLVSSLGLAGDLFESGLKRSVKVKNSGELLPGHGGILDRFDSLLLVTPVVLILFVLVKLVL